MKFLVLGSTLLPLTFALHTSLIYAQPIIPAADDTGTNITVNGNEITIDGGSFSVDGQNLFHSFQEFGLNTNQIANFLSNPQIRNILGRIVGGNTSVIDGLIQVTGGNSNLFLMNPAGFIFGENASLNVLGDFTATTATGIGFGENLWFDFDTTNYQTLVGNPSLFQFNLEASGTIINEGNLSVLSGQNLTLTGGSFTNSGTISAPNGNLIVTAIEGTNRVRIFQEGSLLSLEITLPEDGIVSALDLPGLLTGTPGYSVNEGEISSDNVQIEARTLINRGIVSGERVEGDFQYFVNSGEIRADARVDIAASERILQTAGGMISATGGGDILLNSASYIISGTLDASNDSGVGGNIHILGDYPGLAGATVDASGLWGGGEVLIGGDYQGLGNLPTAENTLVHNTDIFADATESGDGGKVILWANNQTRFSGNISVRGGTLGGDGGFVEVSGKQGGTFAGLVDAGATLGEAGTLLLDPKNITIADGGDPGDIGFSLIQTINNPAPGASDQFGIAVDIDGTNIVVGANLDDTGATDAGSAYVLNTSGTLLATLNNPTPGVSDNFGISVAIDGSNIVVGADFDDTGAVDAGSAYLFDTDGNLLQTLNNPTPSFFDTFGNSVAIYGSNIVVGERFDNTGAVDAGSAYIFDIDGTLLQTLNHPTLSQSDEFGSAVAIDGNTIVVTAPVSLGVTGGLFVYVYDTDGNLLQTLNNPTSIANDQFGSSVAIDGSTIVVGAHRNDTGATNAGSVYIFDTSGNLLQTLNNPAPNNLDEFGFSVAIDGTTVVVGSPFDDTGIGEAGSAYVFDTSGNLLQTLNNPIPEAGDQFGYSVAIDGSNIVLGARFDDIGATDTGSAYVYGLSTPPDIGLIQTLLNPTPFGNDQFGHAVAIEGTNIVVGANLDDTGATDAGSAYVFDTSSTLLATLNNPTPSAGDEFGFSVAIDGTNIVVGANLDDTGATDAGSAYLYDTDGNLLQTLNNPTPVNFDEFGWSVAVDGSNIVVGAVSDDTGDVNTGSAYLYDTNGNLLQTLNNPTPEAADAFGVSVAIDGTNIVVGAHLDNTGATSAGSAYIYDISGSLLQTLNNPTPAVSDEFGRAVAIDGTNIIVGAWLDDTGTIDAGSAYLFDTSGNLLQTFNHPTPAGGGGDNFGESVAIDGTNIVVGAGDEDTGGLSAGSAYLYDIDGTLIETINNPTPEVNDTFGESVAIDGTNILIGAQSDNTALADAGAAYLYSLSSLVNTPTLFSASPSDDFTFDADLITNTTDTGTAIILQANTDITVNEAIITNNASGIGGDIILQAGRSILVNADITTDDGNLTLSANDPDAIASERDAGAGTLDIAAGVTIDTGAGDFTATLGDGESGGIVVNPTANITTTGSITFNANLAGTATGNFIGIDINGNLTTTTGNITLTGTGGDSGSNNHGIAQQSGAAITSTSGDISLTGIGGTGTDDHGIFINNGTITSGGLGTLTLAGIRTSSSSSRGILITDGTVTGTGTGDLIFQTDDLEMTGTSQVQGNSNFILEPVLSDDDFTLSENAFSSFSTGFSEILIGATDGSGDITFSGTNFTFTAPVTLQSPGVGGSINGTGQTIIAPQLTITTGDTVNLGTTTVTGDLNITAGGNITDSGVLTITGTTTLNSGNNITLNNSNDFSTITITNANNVTLNDIDDLDLSTSNLTGNLTISTAGNITDSGDLTIAGITNLNAGLNNIILDRSGNTFGTLSLTGANVTLNENEATEFGLSNLTGNLSVDANGNITQSDEVIVGGIVTLDAGSNDITLTDSNNQFGTLELNGNNVTLNENAATDLGLSTITGNFDLTSTGMITNSGTLTVGGNASFTTSVADTGNVSLTNTTATVFDTTTVGGDFTLTSTGNVTQLGNVKVAADVNIDAPDFTLNNPENILSGLTFPTGDVVITQVGTITVAGQNFTGNLTVNSLETGEQFDGVFSGDAITLNNSGNSFGGTVSLTTDFPTLTTTTGTPGINQLGTVIVAGTTILNATSTGNILFDDINNQLGEVQIVGNNVTLTEIDGVNLGLSTITGDLTVTAGGDIIQTGDLSVGGTTTLDAGLNNIILTGNNDFNFLTITQGNQVNLNETKDLTLGAIAINETLTITAPTGILTTTIDLNLPSAIAFTAAQIDLNNNLTSLTGDLILNGNIILGNPVTWETTNQNITVTGLVDSLAGTNNDLTLNSGTGNITFNQSIGSINPIGNFTITMANDVITTEITASQIDITATNQITSSASHTTFGGPLNLTADNTITVADLETRSLTDEGGAITITSTNNEIITGNLNSSGTTGGAIFLNAFQAITTGTIDSQGSTGNGGNVTLDTMVDIEVVSIDAQGGDNGTGGNVDVTVGQFFRATGSFTDDNGVDASISSAGGQGGGSIIIRHGGNGKIPFDIGDGTNNGSAAAITSGEFSFVPQESFLFDTILGNLQILSGVNPPPPVTPEPPPPVNPEPPPPVNPEPLPPVNPELPSTVNPEPPPPVNPEPPPPVNPEPPPPVNPEPPPPVNPIDQVQVNESYYNNPVVVSIDAISDSTTLGDSAGVEQVEASFTNTFTNYFGGDIQTVGETQTQNLNVSNVSGIVSVDGSQTDSDASEADEESSSIGQNVSISLAQMGATLENIVQATGVKPALIYVTFVSSGISNSSDLRLEPQLTDELQLYLVTGTGQFISHRIKEVTRRDVLTVASRFRKAVGTRQEDYIQSGQRLYQWLIAPLEENLQAEGIENLALAMDAGLRSLPLAAIHDGQGFIVERYSIGLIPSLSLTDTRYVNIQNLEVLAMGASQFKDDTLDPLPGAEAEVQIITEQVWQGEYFLNDEFSANNLRQVRSNQPFGIVHFATHGKFRRGEPSNSFIQFGDEKLGLDQIRQLGLHDPPVELMVLSACNTALGDHNAELGFAGLAVQAGVKTALGSLWTVSDEGTMGLMTMFYQHLKQVPIKAEALRQAQLSMIRGEVRVENGQVVTSAGTVDLPSEVANLENTDLTHPYFWSAFTLIGNPW